jgi:DNA-binding NtrC family response regulator
VDDEHTLVEMGCQMLENLGYRVDGFSSSTDAYDFFRRHADKIDLVITDLTMPMMTGNVLGEKIMDIKPDIPIIICTGYSEHFSEETAKRSGFKGFANKPVVLSELAAMVRSVLDIQKQPA